MALDTQKQVESFGDFISSIYTNQISEIVQKGSRSLTLDFLDLSKFNLELAELLINEPEEVIRAAEIALDSFDIPYKNIRVRISNLPKSHRLMIRDIRSEHLGKFLAFEGIVRQSSDVRPQITSATFECPACGNRIRIHQVDTKFKEPTRCTCSRRGRFTLVSKELVDAQRLVVEEAPESLEGGEQPKRLSVFLREDLVEPKMEKKTTPGSKIRVTGIIKEVAISLKTGAQSVRYDIAAEANQVEPLEQTYEDIIIAQEDVAEIKSLAADPRIYEKLKNSIAPTVFGHDDVKEALVLQLMGGVRKTKEDGTKTRGDMHVLLVGDPGSAKSTILLYLSKMAPKGRYIAGKSSSGAGLCIAPDSLVLTNPGGIYEIKEIVEENLVNHGQIYDEGIWNSSNIVSNKKIFTLDSNLKIKPKEINQLWRINPPDYMIKLITKLGKELIVTPNTKLYTEDLSWKEAIQFKAGDYIATTRNLSFESDNAKDALVLDLIRSNPVVIGIKDKVNHLITKTCNNLKVDKRTLAKKLKLPENNLYHHWINENARGNIKLNALRKLSESANLPLKNIIGEDTMYSLYNGHMISLPKHLNNELLYLAGLIAGDGDLSKGQHTVTIRFSNSSKQLMNRFRNISEQLFNIKPKISSKQSDKRPESYSFSSKLVFEILNSLGIPTSPKSHRIDMSNTLLNLPNELLSYYLSGYFDTDGGCIERTTKGSNYIESTSTSKVFSEKLKLVLLRYGIISSIREKKPTVNKKINGKYTKFIISIYGRDNLEKFRRFIGFNHEEKREKLDRIINKITKANTNIDVIPNARKLINQIERDLKIKILNRRDKNGISRAYLLKLLPKLITYKHKNIDLIYNLANSDILWDKVKNKQVIKCNYPYVYDLTVENSHNFIVNGVLVHNTATVVKDEFLRGWALEAGAMVLANGGFAMIDEMDKMNPEDRSALHEAMEQQRITIHKANIQATLKAETTVLAAANPKFGRFDPYQPIASQIDLPPTLINRFDLIFPIKDLPNKEKDEKIASHVLNLHRRPDSIKSEIPIPLMKKYIAYARQRIHPMLTESAIDEIKDFYVNLRNSTPTTSNEELLKPIPISARQLEALVRLAEASARARLSSMVKRDDARRAISLLKHCLMQVGFDYETGQIDIDKISTGITTAQRSKMVLVREIINELEKKMGKSIPLQEVVNEASNRGIDEDKVMEVIDKMRKEGMVFEPKRGFLSKI